MRVALRLDVWKNAPSREMVLPLERAETAYGTGDFAGAENALDQLAVRFAEPRWPTMPKPFRDLRVSIPPPQPPHWDPEHGLAAEAREANKGRRAAELQVTLAEGVLAWAAQHAVALDDAQPLVADARAALTADTTMDQMWSKLDAFWSVVRARVPMPSASPARAAPAVEADAA